MKHLTASVHRALRWTAWTATTALFTVPALLSPTPANAGAAATVPPPQPGYTFDATITGREDGDAVDARMRVRIRGDRARIDILQSYNDFKTGDYLLTVDRGATFLHVSEQRHFVHSVDAGWLRRDVESQQQGVSLSVSTPTFTPTDAAANRHGFRLQYRMTGRKFLFPISISGEATFDFRLPADGEHAGPDYNPIVDLLVLLYAEPLFKRHDVAPSAVLAHVPGGAIESADLSSHLRGAYREDDAVSIRCTPPTSATLDTVLFEPPGR